MKDTVFSTYSQQWTDATQHLGTLYSHANSPDIIYYIGDIDRLYQTLANLLHQHPNDFPLYGLLRFALILKDIIDELPQHLQPTVHGIDAFINISKRLPTANRNWADYWKYY